MKRVMFFSLLTLSFANAAWAAGAVVTKWSAPPSRVAISGSGRTDASPVYRSSPSFSPNGLFHPAVYSHSAGSIHDAFAKRTSGYAGRDTVFGGSPSSATGFSHAFSPWTRGSGQGFAHFDWKHGNIDHRPPALSGATARSLSESATFSGGFISVREVVVTRASGSTIFGRYRFVDGALSASGSFAEVNGVWKFTVRTGFSVAVFSINRGQILTAYATPFLGCIDCGGTGNVGAFEGIGNLSTTSGNNNIGLFNGDFNTGTLSGNGNVGVLNGNFNGSTNNGNANIGLLNGNFNGIGYAPASGDGGGDGNKNTGVFNGNFNGDSVILATFH